MQLSTVAGWRICLIPSLKQSKVSTQSVPSFLLADLGFSPSGSWNFVSPAPVSEAPGAEDAVDSGSASSGAIGSSLSGSGGHFELGTHSVKHADLPEEARSLDSMLYNIMRINIIWDKCLVKGCKNESKVGVRGACSPGTSQHCGSTHKKSASII